MKQPGIDYYEFQSGDAGKETIHISEDPNNTVTWVPDNRCYDARNGYVGHDGISFLPFNQNGDDKDVANCGFAAKMAFNFRSTYDGKLSSKNGQESVFLSGLNSMGMMISSSISTGSWRLTSAVLTRM